MSTHRILPPYPTPWDSSTAGVPRKDNPTPNEPRYYYFAYGSNLWLSQMNHRCPQYTYVGHGVLRGYRWVISTRRYANVVPSQLPPSNGGEQEGKKEGREDDGSVGADYDNTLDTYGVVYTLTKSDMDTLDMFEGTETKPVPAYVKVTMDIEMFGSKFKKDFEAKKREDKDWTLPCLVYVDPRTREGKPYDEYIGRINRGLKDANLPKKWVEKVIRKWIPAGVGVGDPEEEEESDSEVEEKDIGERKGVRNGLKTKSKVEGQFVHWVPTGV